MCKTTCVAAAAIAGGIRPVQPDIVQPAIPDVADDADDGAPRVGTI
jgi:hypothetical protein